MFLSGNRSFRFPSLIDWINLTLRPFYILFLELFRFGTLCHVLFFLSYEILPAKLDGNKRFIEDTCKKNAKQTKCKFSMMIGKIDTVSRTQESARTQLKERRKG